MERQEKGGKTMSKTVVLLVYGGGDFGAMTFEQNFKAQEVYEQMVAEGVTKKDVIYDDPRYGEEEITCEIHEFGEVDISFVTFVMNQFVDYDELKRKDFHFVEAKEEKS